LGSFDVFDVNPLTLGLADAELDRITAGTINIGDSNSGNLTLSATIDRTAATTINVTSGANISFGTSGSLTSAGGKITLTSGSTGAITSGPAATVDINSGLGATSLSAGSGGIGVAANPLVVSAVSFSSVSSANANQFLAVIGNTTIGAPGLDAGTGTIELDAGVLALGASNQVNDSTNLKVNGGTFGIGVNSETVGGITLTQGSITGSSGM